ncbi:TlpA family protein disulfide reductase [Paenibacillus naphthalenovorans]|uniref:TlpA family protein disulfide reductase n=1 Tax=Paenibacillus naphthalenovorans TaxID=162209 RepID=UPI0010B7D1EC|nr:TlpA disulfide reductase family protein [Paenibacillus naphthalenovorans]GCL73771.1 TlpA family protein disulfide reductase [Paenibacillus naphthalenovorans]
MRDKHYEAERGDRTRNRFALLVIIILVIVAIVNHVRADTKETPDRPASEDFFLESLEGEWVRLSDYRGKPVLLNFWASWCPPCKEEMPAIIEFASSHPDIEVLTANLTFTELSLDRVAEFVKEQQLLLPVLLDDSGTVARKYGITAYPSSLIFNQEGRRVETIVGQTDLARLENAFKALTKTDEKR